MTDWPHRPPLPCPALRAGRIREVRGELVCDACPHPIHDLRDATRREADAFVARHAGDASLCVVLRLGSDGRVRFAPGPSFLPTSTLLWRLRAPALAGGLSVMAACATPASDSRESVTRSEVLDAALATDAEVEDLGDADADSDSVVIHPAARGAAGAPADGERVPPATGSATPRADVPELSSSTPVGSGHARRARRGLARRASASPTRPVVKPTIKPDPPAQTFDLCDLMAGSLPPDCS